jgi:DNA gyrase/topoisomerase IV subunit B
VAKNKSYTSDDIVTLSDREHVRLRTQIYLGNTHPTSYNVPVFLDGRFAIESVEFVPAVYKAVGEIIDNSIDEFAQINQKDNHLKIVADPINGCYTIGDNGRGIPIDKHESGKFTPEVALGSLRAGRNFSDEKEAGVIGQNGVGSACTNYCSSEFHIQVNRDGKKYTQSFSNGAESVTKPSIRKGPAKTGTEVSFTLDPTVFKDVALPPRLMNNRAIELAFTNPNIVVEYNKHKYKYHKGLEDIVKKLVKSPILDEGSYFKFMYEQDGLQMEFYVIHGVYEGLDEQIFSWVNSSLLFDGGLCNTQFLNSFYDKVATHLKTAAKKQKVEVTKNDVRQNLLVLGNLKIANPEYDAQSKTRLTGPNTRKEMGEMMTAMWTSFSRKNKQWLEEVLNRAIDRHHTSANKKAIKDHTKTLSKKVPGLVDATSKMRFNCQVLVTEGESAASMITEARDPVTTATFALTGKINNAYGSTPAQILQMGKITNLLAVIGLVPGKRAVRSDLRFGKIIIATDADVDGGDIFTLLVNLFYTFWPELFNPDYEPVIHRLVAPNVCVTKGNKRIHFTTHKEYEKHKSKYKGWEIRYYKGLGSMAKKDWEILLGDETDSLIPITDDGNMKDVLELLFGPSAENRKRWLQNES